MVDWIYALIWLLLYDSGNLDERVTDRVLYDILIQAGRVVDLHIPKDKESEKPKGFAFAEYESEGIADYDVRLCLGLCNSLQQNTQVCGTSLTSLHSN